jgi:hypothetical protein
MPGEDSLSSRFDYLFEPLDVDESTDDAIDTGASESSADRAASASGAPVRMAFAAFVLGALGFVAVIALLLMEHPNEITERVQVPREPAPLSMTVPNAPSPAGLVPPPAIAVPAEASQAVDTRPVQQPAPQPQQTQPTSPPERQRGVTNSPTTRAPISVAPASRSPFPNQAPQPGDGRSGGLLGGGLPGPL